MEVDDDIVPVDDVLPVEPEVSIAEDEAPIEPPALDIDNDDSGSPAPDSAPSTRRAGDADPDYEPDVEVVPDDDEAELSLAERLRHRTRRSSTLNVDYRGGARGRPRRRGGATSGRPREVQALLDDLKLREPVTGRRTYGRQQLPKDLNVAASLVLECENDGLSDAQMKAQNEARNEFKQAQDKINEMIKNQTILFQSKQTMVLQSATSNVPLRPSGPKVAIPPAPKVMPISTLKVTNTRAPPPSILRTQNRQNVQLIQQGSPGGNITYLLQQAPGKNANSALLRALTPGSVRFTSQNLITAAPTGTTPTTIPITQMTPQQIPANVQMSAAPAATGGVIDLTQEDSVDSREITFNKLSGKTFPSLVVTARPNLRVKDLSPSALAKERANLDGKVKTVLVCSPTKFTEWLIQQGLVRSEQFCSLHRDMAGNPVKLKLGMYSDNTKFPFSGGYVWISECCPQKFVSVFSGSLFESSPHPPTILLKLIYHWCCQTSVNNVVQWVKVDNFYVKNFFTLLRSVCTAAVHTKMGFIGGINRYVEVGVISLGTTSQDGNQRQVKVEVLGVLEHEARRVRLMAVEPMVESERNLRKRFSKILEPLTQWVHPASTILTDFSIDKSTLHALGFNIVVQTNANDAGPTLGGKKRNNANIMDYLRKVVPRMFLNTLSLLNRSLIQQFLDELTWRELWGYSPPLTFDNIIGHLAEQTKADYPTEQLVSRLSNIAVNPFKNWNYVDQAKNVPQQMALAPLMVTQAVSSPSQQGGNDMDMLPASLCEVQYAPGPAHSKRPRAQKTPQPIVNSAATSAIKRVKLNTSMQTYLDAYYYADMAGQSSCVIGDQDGSFSVKCIICPTTFVNNVALMKHLIGHVVYETNEPVRPGKDLFCNYCLKKVASVVNQTTHKKDAHMLSTATTSCCICQKKFHARAQLIQHMAQSHVASELPYSCNICHFRSSFHYKIIDHFHETHTGGCSLQCPLCLKVFFASGSRSRTPSCNLMAFYQHLVGHKRQSNRRKCDRCCLVFQQSKQVFEHEELDHRCMKNTPRVVPVVSTESNPTIIIPTPSGPPPVLQSERGAATKAGHSYTRKPLYPTPDIDVDESFMCIECKKPLTQLSHLNYFMNCLLCPYSTCCSTAMEMHVSAKHSGRKQASPTNDSDTILPQPMFCICGFKSYRGNQMADHLEECERRTAYPTPGIEAQSASFPPLVNLEGASADDLNNKWMQAYVNKEPKETGASQVKPDDDGSIMGFLGLVRKPSTDEKPPDEPKDEQEQEVGATEPEAEIDDEDEPPEMPLETEVTESGEVMQLD